MASIFKRKRKVRDTNGRVKVKKSACWYVEYRDKDGKTLRVKGYKDLAATRQKAAELEREAERCQAGLVDRYKEHRKRPLLGHLEDFGESLRAGNTEAHVKVTCSRTKRIIEDCKFDRWDNISGSRAKEYLTGLLKSKEISSQTYNYYLASI